MRAASKAHRTQRNTPNFTSRGKAFEKLTAFSPSSVSIKQSQGEGNQTNPESGALDSNTQESDAVPQATRPTKRTPQSGYSRLHGSTWPKDVGRALENNHQWKRTSHCGMQRKRLTIPASTQHPLCKRAPTILHRIKYRKIRGSQYSTRPRNTPHITQQLIPETSALLQCICTFPPAPPDTLSTEITEGHLKKLYHIIPETTSSSPSGRHIGHYKALPNSDALLPLITKMIQMTPHALVASIRWCHAREKAQRRKNTLTQDSCPTRVWF